MFTLALCVLNRGRQLNLRSRLLPSDGVELDRQRLHLLRLLLFRILKNLFIFFLLFIILILLHNILVTVILF